MKNKLKIPTLLGLLILLSSIAGGVVLVTGNPMLLVKADLSEEPKNVNIVNISSHQAAVYWQTDQPTIGFVQIGNTPILGKTIPDDRDQDTPTPHPKTFY